MRCVLFYVENVFLCYDMFYCYAKRYIVDCCHNVLVVLILLWDSIIGSCGSSITLSTA